LTSLPDNSLPIAAFDEKLRAKQLQQMKLRAAGLLILAAVAFAISHYLGAQYQWLGWVQAFSEAAMVGGLADWFAVTALFRHPLGLPIPHTAIIPSRKDRVGEVLGAFVERNFLSRQVIERRLLEAKLGERLAKFLSEPANSMAVARHAARGLVAAAESMRDDDVQAMIDSAILDRIKAARVAPFIGRGLSLITAGNRHQTASQCDGRAARGATAGLRQIVRVASRAKDGIERLRSGAKFRSVGLSKGDGPGLAHPFDHDVVFGRNVVLVKRRSEGGADAARFQ